MTLRGDGLARLLRICEQQAVDDGSGDVVFAMFLEPHEAAPDASFGDKLITFAVNNLQQAPVMAHVELVVPCGPCSKGPVNFATYIGERSKWQADAAANRRYYLSENANRWRAVPVFGQSAARMVREACDASVDVPYSLARYATAWFPFRFLSGMVPDGPRRPAHCATLAARVLRCAVGACLKHRAPWYSPASLYRELCDDLAEQKIRPVQTLMSEDAAASVDALLRHADDDVRALSHERVMAALRSLTLKAAAAEAAGDGAARRLAQRQLATALFRWSVNRDCFSK